MARHRLFLLINPWIFDFAAYDLWSRPLGLLYLASLLRASGHGVQIINCLDYSLKEDSGEGKSYPATRRRYGTGKFKRTPVQKPEALKFVPRKFCRYGISKETLRRQLQDIEKPNAVLVTSLMTYWYPGVAEAVKMVKEILPDVPVVLGGSYARLCHAHAVSLPGIDFAFLGTLEEFPEFLEQRLRIGIAHPHLWKDFRFYPYPAYDLWNPKPLDAVAIMTSQGCPFRCPYCASGVLYPQFTKRSPESVFGEIIFWHEKFGVRDFAFYDDALLVDSKNHIVPILKKVTEEKVDVRFHTPNAVHVRELSAELCELMKAAGFTTLRLGLETANVQRLTQKDNKVERGQFPWAMENLKKAGFLSEQIGIYLLCGLPNQDPSEVEYSINVVKEHGGWPYLAEYSPIPETELWETAVKVSPFPIAREPLFQNNTLFPCQSRVFSLSELERLKKLAKEARC